MVLRRPTPFQSSSPALPDRVLQLLRENEAESERLIGWIQLSVAGLWSALFFLSPRPADAPETMLFEPVAMALAAYLAFTVARLWTAYRRRLPPAIIVLSVFADVGVLLWLIWSFHDQYGQGAAFSLKVPTFLYMFVFVALRALRFDPRLVWAAGATAAVGWIALVALAVERSEPGTITRSFVAYVNGDQILLGAELDKVLTLLIVATVLALAVQRARTVLVTAVREQAAAKDMRRFMAGGVADAITGAENAIEAGRAEEREAAILMLDIRGFTRFSRHVAPTDVVAMLTSLHARLVPIVEAHGGVVDKFLGDGAMITFGAVEPSRASAADAFRALDDVLSAAEAWEREIDSNVPLVVNAAVTAGTVVFATLGSADRLEYTVIGEPVNLAAKLEKHNKVEKSRAIAPAEVLQRARRQGYESDDEGAWTERARCTVADVGTPLDVVVRRAPATHPAATVGGSNAPVLAPSQSAAKQ